MFEIKTRRAAAIAGGVFAVLTATLLQVTSVSVAEAASGGTVSGVVKLAGAPPPAPAPVPVTANPEKCGTEHTADLLAGPDGSVRWAVIRIVGAKGEFPADAEPPTLDQRGCRFSPHVVFVPVGKPLRVLNNDGILHNVHTFPEKNTPLNSAQPGFRKTMDTTFTTPEIVRVGCDVHPWMSARIVVTDTPFVAVTDASGAFSIAGVPAGNYTVSVWHETFGEQTQQVKVADGQTAKLSVTMTAK